MNSTHFKCIFLGFLMAALGLTAVGRPVGTDTEVGIRYLDHSVDPNVILGIREHGSQYIYMVQLQLVSYGDTYTSACEVNRVQLEDYEWHEWCVEDANPWVPYKARHIKARTP
ncbi:MAG TPA: hypothetical protein VMU54_07260 [Planctomycetota bacterium]|nr:hypothetical protein [Planctomycetota bacterium]